MRGTTLLLDDERSRLLADHLRRHGLIVDVVDDPGGAAERLRRSDADVIVAAVASAGTAVVRDLRAAAEHATSIIVVGEATDREPARAAGADSFLLKPVSAADLLYEIRRALILRRSGRRLPWNW